ncbi:gamma-glutamyl-gamma-aminobutyrate hydrolase family protein [Wansuia hejianensis]|uniref:Gamma-glutamyl-gamma-aminobutyrate hydrolase family protein n=1 Tax=Wansuia hejianensis TaxID=2763667 RepID=A0A926EYS7_9FIRM|nr:gamma-glutamyl-gamma-aminobutyrate hydrolase family protein [Wansuia hejianensis]MBC8590975.1 gamma-glutamyl-gamma-aminobutyrate hydrolase family protein [Wansuia hejianensis]
MKPVIGLTSQIEYSGRIKLSKINYTYIKAISEGGGVPIIIPNLKRLEDIDKYLDMIDGLIFTGGEDVSPLLFDENPIKEVTHICYERDTMELTLFKKAYNRGIPIFGICRGIQLINIGLGGSLYQDINRQVPNSLGHVSAYRIEGGYHTIDIEEDTILYDIFNKKKICVNSQHHQSVKSLGKNLKINSTSSDGIIEGIESTNEKFVLGVQFHPEAMIDRHEEFKGIFEHFIVKCEEYTQM